MKMVGNEVYIQRGEIWSLDFEVVDRKGHPIAVLREWRNPYIAISVAASLYEQKGDYRETYWLDLNAGWVENEKGEIGLELIPRKRFTSAEALPLNTTKFAINEILATYGIEKGGNIVLDKTSDFDVTNFLFYIDPLNDGNYVYKFVKDYTLDNDNDVDIQVWEEYDFRIVKHFTTRDWMEQSYYYDVKIVTGETVQEHVTGILTSQGVTDISTDTWTENDWNSYLDMIEDESIREEMQGLYDEGAPLMPDFETQSILLEPTPIYVSVNLQGGTK